MPGGFSEALKDITSVWPALRPPARVTVSEGIARIMHIGRPGGASVRWSAEEVPYMRKPCDLVGGRQFSAVCFVGPAQSGKTAALVDGVACHAIVNDPGDMLIVQMTQDKAREYSSPRLDRMITHSPALRELLTRDNIHDKMFRNGMVVRIAWPTPSNLASTSYRYGVSTDYDRVEDNIGGEGDLFSMLTARTRTFMSRGKVIVESSPGRDVKDPKWRPSSDHEAPPVGGVLGIYNRGTRNRLYWKCPHCGEWFQSTPGLGLFRLPSTEELLEDIRTINIDAFCRQYARIVCPNSGCIINFEHRGAMNANHRWLEEGLQIDDLDRVSGTPRSSSIASFWMGGVAAAYTTWERLLRTQMQGLLSLALEGQEEALQTAANLDQGIPYTPRSLVAQAGRASTPRDRADPGVSRYVVPPWTRYLLAFVDVQGGRSARFVVQVHAVGPHQQEQLVDRFAITKSDREGIGEVQAAIDPGGREEDWDVLIEKVVNATYRTPHEGVELRVLRTLVDSGGEEGVTHNAYRWMRRLRQRGLASRVYLTKGDPNLKADWYVKETQVGFQGKSGARGDITLHLMNVNKIKDIVQVCLDKETEGPGHYTFPAPKHPVTNPDGWLPDSFFDELAAETRGDDGRWRQTRRSNEALDACVGIKAGSMILGVDRRGFWDSPPPWALEITSNSEAISSDARRSGGVEPMRPATTGGWVRRTKSSGYLSS